MSKVTMNIEIDELEKEMVQLLSEKSQFEQTIRQSTKNIKNLEKSNPHSEQKIQEEEEVIEAARAEMESRNFDERISSIQKRYTKLKSKFFIFTLSISRFQCSLRLCKILLCFTFVSRNEPLLVGSKKCIRTNRSIH